MYDHKKSQYCTSIIIPWNRKNDDSASIIIRATWKKPVLDFYYFSRVLETDSIVRHIVCEYGPGLFDNGTEKRQALCYYFAYDRKKPLSDFYYYSIKKKDKHCSSIILRTTEKSQYQSSFIILWWGIKLSVSFVNVTFYSHLYC